MHLADRVRDLVVGHLLPVLELHEVLAAVRRDVHEDVARAVTCPQQALQSGASMSKTALEL